ncbi:uncharacterized protein [Amphiura filiformis]|uniref:uncharacterized protein n=1 Tax=Amphiura filiformis TaxID=82378 RepID=UPI003B212006
MKYYSDRVISLIVQLTGNKQLCVIQVYAPTSDYDDEKVEELYEEVNKAIEDSKAEYTIVMGDFNAKIGECQSGEEAIMGKFGVGERNKRGDMLLEFAAQQGLIIANTYFKKHKNRYWTWESPNGITKNQIDFILSSQRGIVEDCSVITSVDIGSDHRMVRAKIHIDRKLARLKIIRNQKKMEAAEEIAPRERKTKQTTEEDKAIEELDKKRKELREVEDKSPKQKIEYSELVKTVRKKRRERSRKRKKQQIESILESGKGPKQITKMNSKKTRICQMRQKNGSITTDREEILNVCTEFYQDLYSSKTDENSGTRVPTKSTDDTEVPNITVREVEKAVTQMKNNKAPGPDDVSSDIFKIGGGDQQTAALRRIGVNETYVLIIEDIYTDAVATIHLDNDVSNHIHIKRGVRQGDTISPKIFTAAMEEIFKKLDLEKQGINIDGEWLTDLRFADDVALTTTSVKDMEIQLNGLNSESKKIGLKIHKGKTKFMTNFETNEPIVVETDEIEKVESYKYLGQTVKLEDNTREEVLIRIKAGWSCFGRYKDILCDKKLSMILRKRVFNQCVLPTMTYGCETWTTTKYLEQKLITTQRAMERRMLNITIRDKIRNTYIRNKTKVKDILEKIKEAKWRWAGHLARSNDNRWTKRLTEWQPRTGRRRRGRQKRRWRDDITSYIGTTWARIAQDRETWKLHEEGYSRHGLT